MGCLSVFSFIVLMISNPDGYTDAVSYIRVKYVQCNIMRSDWGKLPIYDYEKNASIFLIHDRRKENKFMCSFSL